MTVVAVRREEMREADRKGESGSETGDLGVWKRFQSRKQRYLKDILFRCWYIFKHSGGQWLYIHIQAIVRGTLAYVAKPCSLPIRCFGTISASVLVSMFYLSLTQPFSRA